MQSQWADRKQGADGSTIERRRPGRIAYLNPHLIAMLRGSFSSGEAAVPCAGDAFDSISEQEMDGLAAARGIGLAILMSTAFWAAIAGSALLAGVR